MTNFGTVIVAVTILLYLDRIFTPDLTQFERNNAVRNSIEVVLVFGPAVSAYLLGGGVVGTVGALAIAANDQIKTGRIFA